MSTFTNRRKDIAGHERTFDRSLLETSGETTRISWSKTGEGLRKEGGISEKVGRRIPNPSDIKITVKGV